MSSAGFGLCVQDPRRPWAFFEYDINDVRERLYREAGERHSTTCCMQCRWGQAAPALCPAF